MNGYERTVESLDLVLDSGSRVHVAREDGHTACGLNAADVTPSKEVGLPRRHPWCSICQDIYTNRSLIISK
jgi:hypothetical protein